LKNPREPENSNIHRNQRIVHFSSPLKFNTLFPSGMDTHIPRDYVGLLQERFEDVVNTMFTTVLNIQRDAAAPAHSGEPNPIRFEQLPSLADQIVRKVKAIDALIDEANEETCLGKDIDEIREALARKSADYEERVNELSGNCRLAEAWSARIRKMLVLIADHTPWLRRSPDAI
jgi:hypothetical protein